MKFRALERHELRVAILNELRELALQDDRHDITPRGLRQVRLKLDLCHNIARNKMYHLETTCLLQS